MRSTRRMAKALFPFMKNNDVRLDHVLETVKLQGRVVKQLKDIKFSMSGFFPKCCFGKNVSWCLLLNTRITPTDVML